MGTPLDRGWRETQKRKDDDSYRTLISEARANLYEKNWAIDGDHVAGLLKDMSLVPTEARDGNRFDLRNLLMCSPERILIPII